MLTGMGDFKQMTDLKTLSFENNHTDKMCRQENRVIGQQI